MCEVYIIAIIALIDTLTHSLSQQRMGIILTPLETLNNQPSGHGGHPKFFGSNLIKCHLQT